MEAGGTGGVVCLLLIYFFKSPLRHLILGTIEIKLTLLVPGLYFVFLFFIFHVFNVLMQTFGQVVYFGVNYKMILIFFFFILSSLLNALSPFDIFLCH